MSEYINRLATSPSTHVLQIDQILDEYWGQRVDYSQLEILEERPGQQRHTFVKKCDLTDLMTTTKEYKLQPEHTTIEMPFFFKQAATEVQRWTGVRVQEHVILAILRNCKTEKFGYSVHRLCPLSVQMMD